MIKGKSFGGKNTRKWKYKKKGKAAREGKRKAIVKNLKRISRVVFIDLFDNRSADKDGYRNK